MPRKQPIISVAFTTEHETNLVKRAAAVAGMTPSAFLRQLAIKRSNEVIASAMAGHPTTPPAPFPPLPRLPELAPLIFGPATVMALGSIKQPRPPEDPVATKRRAGFKVIRGGR